MRAQLFWKTKMKIQHKLPTRLSLNCWIALYSSLNCKLKTSKPFEGKKTSPSITFGCGKMVANSRIYETDSHTRQYHHFSCSILKCIPIKVNLSVFPTEQPLKINLNKVIVLHHDVSCISWNFISSTYLKKHWKRCARIISELGVIICSYWELVLVQFTIAWGLFEVRRGTPRMP